MAEPAGPGQAPTPAQVRRSRPGYAVLRGLGALAAVVLVAGATFSTVPGMARQETTTVVPVEGVELSALEQTRTVRVEATRGQVVVREGGPGVAPSVTASSRWSFRQPELVVTDSGAQLLVSAPCPSGNLGTCAVDLELLVPRGTAVEVRATLGDVDVVSTGDVTVASTLGNVRVSGAPGSVRAETSLGDVRVRAQEPPSLVWVTSSLGNIDVEVPGDAAYALDVETSQGTQDVRVPQDAGAERTIRARTSLGNVRIAPGG